MPATRAALKEGNPDIRMRMRMHLQGLIEKIEIFPVGFTKVAKDVDDGSDNAGTASRSRGQKAYDAPTPATATDDVEDLATYIRDVSASAELKTDEFKEFCKWVTQRRTSKHGRFIRVYFKTGIRRDIVPGDSCATRWTNAARQHEAA